jgi:hypothetical protein
VRRLAAMLSWEVVGDTPPRSLLNTALVVGSGGTSPRPGIGADMFSRGRRPPLAELFIELYELAGECPYARWGWENDGRGGGRVEHTPTPGSGRGGRGGLPGIDRLVLDTAGPPPSANDDVVRRIETGAGPIGRDGTGGGGMSSLRRPRNMFTKDLRFSVMEVRNDALAQAYHVRIASSGMPGTPSWEGTLPLRARWRPGDWGTGPSAPAWMLRR